MRGLKLLTGLRATVLWVAAYHTLSVTPALAQSTDNTLLRVTHEHTPAEARSHVSIRSESGHQQPPAAAGSPLAGTSWQLVRFEGGDGTVLTPDDPAKYTIALDADGGVSVRIDCNRGRGTWTSNGPGQLQFGALALTRAMCPPDSLHDHVAKQWGYIRSYVLRDGHLFLSLMADGGIYEFEPLAAQSGSFRVRSPVPFRGPALWTCARGGRSSGTVRVTLYETQPVLALLERYGVTRPAFQVRAGR